MWEQLSTEALVAAVQSGDLTATNLAESCLKAVSDQDRHLGAFLSVDADDVRQQADALDRKRASGQPLGLLAGVPIGIKDVLCVKGQPAGCASKFLAGYRSPFDAHVIEQLRQADAILFGRTNMDEFAMGSSSENSAFQLTRNPWNLAYTPGGSSSGAAACVAARLVPLSLGSDTGGSIRQPASLCGIVGLKPTYGRVSRYGLIAFASSLDQIGPFSPDVAGAARLLQSISAPDTRDSTSVDRPVPDYLQNLEQPLQGLRIGFAKEHFADGLDPEVESTIREALNVYRHLGATIKEVSLPRQKYCVAVYYLVAPAEASSNLARFDGIRYGVRATRFNDLADLYATSRGEGFGAEVKRRIMIGTYALSAGYADRFYVKALKARRLIREDYELAFRDVDLLAGPCTPTPGFRFGDRVNDPLQMYLSDVYTIGANLAGLPGMSLPCGFSKNGLPIGLQLIAPAFDEERLLRAARMYERETNWTAQKPPKATGVPA